MTRVRECTAQINGLRVCRALVKTAAFARHWLAVARLTCRLAEEGYEMSLDVDINSDLLPLEINDRFVRAPTGRRASMATAVA